MSLNGSLTSPPRDLLAGDLHVHLEDVVVVELDPVDVTLVLPVALEVAAAVEVTEVLPEHLRWAMVVAEDTVVEVVDSHLPQLALELVGGRSTRNHRWKLLNVCDVSAS